MADIFDDHVEALNTKLKGKVFFIEIGAMDGVNHDALYKHVRKHKQWSGVLVEPLPDMFLKLKDNYSERDNLYFENAAIGLENDRALITRIPLEHVNKECPDWADGIATFKPETHIISRYDYLKPYAVTESVKTITFDRLVEKYQINNIDILQIDTEGMDKEIFEQVWAAAFRPYIIKFEVLYLQYMVILETINQLSVNGYTCSVVGEDLVAARI